jgi:hypothetical protein
MSTDSVLSRVATALTVLKRSILVPLALLVSVCCATAGERASQAGKAAVQTGQPFTLKLGQAITVEAEGLEVGFERVVSDSRCPTGAQCIQEGEAVVRIWLAKPPGQRENRDLATTPKAAEATYGAYQIRLMSLDPYPDLKRPTRPADYAASLRVTRP